MFLFVILFGLSMDYHVFIFSRSKELRDSGLSTEEAISRAIRRTAGTVTSAAIIMVAVFAVFGTLRMIMMKQMGCARALALVPAGLRRSGCGHREPMRAASFALLRSVVAAVGVAVVLAPSGLAETRGTSVRVTPAAGGSGTIFVVSFTTPVRTGVVGSIRLREELTATSTSAGDRKSVV